MSTNNFWTEERENQLRELWAKEWSAKEIAEFFGEPCTRNMIAGKAHRLKLPLRRIEIKQDDKPRMSTERRDEYRKAISTALGTPRKPMELANAGECRWPIGDPKDPAFHFCGASCGRNVYCDLHTKIAGTMY